MKLRDKLRIDAENTSMLRLFLIFLIISIALFILVAAVLLFPIVNSKIEALQGQSDRATADSAAAQLIRYLEARRLVMEDIASDTLIVNAALSGAGDSPALLDFIDSRKIIGANPVLSTIDINAEILTTETDEWTDFSWVTPILEGETSSMVKLIGDGEVSSNLFLAVPVRYRGSTEGVLVGGFSTKPEKFFARNSEDKSRNALRIIQGDNKITTSPVISNNKNVIALELEGFNLSLEYVTDRTAIIQSENQLLLQIAATTFVGSMFSFILLLVVGRQIILQPYKELTQSRRDQDTLIEKLRESNEELERFAYVASHDLQEPLRMVVSFNEILKERLEGKLSGDDQDYFDITTHSAKRMQSMISELLTYARISSETPANEWVDLNETVQYVLSNLSDSINETNAKVTYESMPRVLGNGVRLARLLQNLISNGIKYHASDRAPEVQISVKDFKHHWRICVIDNGIGFRTEYRDQIFYAFKRLHTSNEYSGTGIGLAICRKIVEQMNGKIWAVSNEGEGSRFYFTIPNATNNEKAEDI